MKIWAFTEGHSEEVMLRFLLRKNFSTVAVYDDDAEFIDLESTKEAVRIVNCGSIDAIASEISHAYYRVEKSSAPYVLILGDVEKNLPCPTERAKKIKSAFAQEVTYKNFKFVLNCPVLEKIYWDHCDIVKRVIEIIHKKIYPQNQFSTRYPISLNVPASTNNHIFDLKQMMKAIGLKYREREFAEEFFGRLEFSNCVDPSVKRLIAFLETNFTSC